MIGHKLATHEAELVLFLLIYPECILAFLDLNHSDDACYGQQPLAFYNHHYGSTCYLPLMIFDGVSGGLIAAILRPGKRPFGDENAMIAYSAANWTIIPPQTGHSFQCKLDT